MKLYVVVNVDWFFLSHRLLVALAAQQKGWDVTIVTADTGQLKTIEAKGLRTVNLPMSRSGMNLLQELNTCWFLYKLYRRHQPDVVHHVGIKTILWGTLAAKFAKVHGVVNAISGLGGFFAEENQSLLSKVLPQVLRFSHHRENLLVIFQNQEDRQLYLNHRIITEAQARMIKGSGVDMTEYGYTPEPQTGKIVVLLTARMIVEKGIFVLTDAAERLRDAYEDQLEFWIAGGLDDHPGAITREQLDAVCDGQYIKWLGRREDIKELLQQSYIFAFPSYYMEGLPKSLIEACAIGRPIVTTDNIGCRDVVTDGVNGFLVPVKDSAALTEKIRVLINHPDLRVQMGVASRKVAEEYFSIDSVIEKHLEIYQELVS
jgi:glycosyltransferase involved in cell wall biosynthesis